MADNWDDPQAPRAPAGPRVTGRYLVLGRATGDDALPKALRDQAGIRVASTSDFPQGTVSAAGLAGADGVYFEQLGVAITSTAPDQVGPLMTAQGTGAIAIVEAERVVYLFDPREHPFVSMAAPALLTATGPGALGAAGLVCELTASGVGAAAQSGLDEGDATWGLRVTGVLTSSRTGRGVRVAVLDTGFDLAHPDFAGRSIVSQSFIQGESAQDGHSHGTHCIGTALGTARLAQRPRYGVASEAHIYAAKVLDSNGRGSDGSVLAALDWAIRSGCRIVSMSLGTATQHGQPFSQVFETVGQRALAANTLLVAAAGNESQRPAIINPVGHPANCPSVLAVGAVDAQMRIAPFSTRGFEASGGGVDIVGPGVDVYSTVPMPTRHGLKSGTSMACPHVAGIAALYAEANPGASARELWQLLTRNAKSLPLDRADAGAGLVVAPV